MNKTNKNIFELLKKIELNSYSYNDLKVLIDLSLGIALSHIRYRMNKGFKFPLISVEKIEDIAVEAVSPLFIESVSSGKLTIAMSLNNWNIKIEKESDAEFFLYKIVWSRVEQTLTELIKQNDPFFNRIHKTLTTCIINNDLKKVNYFGKIFVTYDNIDFDGKLIPEDEFNSLPYTLFLEKQYNLFVKILEYIEEETDYVPAVPFNLLVKKIKLLNHNNHTVDIEKNYVNELSVHDIVERSLCDLKEKMNFSYLSQNKITKDEAEAIYKSFEMISSDLKNGGINSSLFNYLSDNMENLSRERFYDEFHGIMNYLYKYFTKRILKNFEN